MQYRRHPICRMHSCNSLKLEVGTNQSPESMPAGIVLIGVRNFVELEFRLATLRIDEDDRKRI